MLCSETLESHARVRISSTSYFFLFFFFVRVYPKETRGGFGATGRSVAYAVASNRNEHAL